MFRHWVGKVTGALSLITAGAPLVWPQFFVGDRGLLLSRSLFFSISAVAFFLASLSAWSEKKDALVKAEEKLEDAIDMNRPEVTAEFTMGPTNNAFMHGGPQVKIVNRGNTDAWHPHIEDVLIGDRKVTFYCPSILPKGPPQDINCSISGVNINAANNLEYLLHSRAIEQMGKEIGEGKGTEIDPESYKVSFDLNIRWADSRGNPFSSVGRVTYSYQNRMARTAFPSGIVRLHKIAGKL